MPGAERAPRWTVSLVPRLRLASAPARASASFPRQVEPAGGLMKTGTGSAIRCIYASAQALLVAVPVPLFISPACGWADENGDWLRNILYLSKSTTAISCGACPPFHQTSLRVARSRAEPRDERRLYRTSNASTASRGTLTSDVPQYA